VTDISSKDIVCGLQDAPAISPWGDKPCYACGSREWWRWKANWICAKCQPPFSHLLKVIERKTI
jgi:hypothetical protein